VLEEYLSISDGATKLVRDFSSEGYVNIALRALKALTIRLRGFVCFACRIFADQSSWLLYIDRGLRVKNGKAIQLGSGVGFGLFARLEVFHTTTHPYIRHPKIIIGEDSSFGDYFHCGAVNSVIIGRRVLGGSHILIADHSHGNNKMELSKPALVAPTRRDIYSKAPIVIEDDVWIGDGVVILAGAHIASGAVIAANTVVRGFVAPRSTFFQGPR